MPMKDGKPDGEARMIRSPFEDGRPIGISAEGRMYFVVESTITNSYILPVDLAAGTAGKPARTTALYEGMNGFATWSPDGKKLAWFGLKEGRNVAGATLVIRDLDTGRERRLAMPEDAWTDTAPEWLSDNRSLVYCAKHRERPSLMRMDTETGEISLITTPFSP